MAERSAAATTFVRSDEARHARHIRGHVSGDLAVHAADTHVEDGRSGLDHVGPDQVRHARRRNDDVGLPDLVSQVAGAGVADGDGGVLGSTGQ